MKKLLLASLLLLSLKSIAQENTGCFHLGSSDTEYSKAMIITDDGNYVMGGGHEHQQWNNRLLCGENRPFRKHSLVERKRGYIY